jgi:hypothetical protein
MRSEGATSANRRLIDAFRPVRVTIGLILTYLPLKWGVFDRLLRSGQRQRYLNKVRSCGEFYSPHPIGLVNQAS